MCITSPPVACAKLYCMVTGTQWSVSSTRRLRSTDTATCVVRHSNNSYGDRCFAAAGPRLWNTLPVQLRHCDSLGQFKRLLKTYLFGGWDRGALWHLLGVPCINHLTYLLTYLMVWRVVTQLLLRPTSARARDLLWCLTPNLLQRHCTLSAVSNTMLI